MQASKSGPVLSVLNRVCFDHILSSSNLPCSAAPSIPTKIHATSTSIPICLIQVSLDLWPSTEAYWLTKGCTLRENWLYLTQTIRIYNCSLERSDLCMQLPSPWWELSCFSLHRYCARYYKPLGVYMWSAPIVKKSFSCSYPLLLTLIILQDLILQRSCALAAESVENTFALGWIFCSTIFSVSWTTMGLYSSLPSTANVCFLDEGWETN